jgi:apolipoprotein D and lipocalin family protein
MSVLSPQVQRRSIRRSTSGLAFIAFIASIGALPALALTPAANFELDRYYGSWYEIAAMRGFLQSRCNRDTRSDYAAGDNGAIITRSRCLRADGMVENTEGRARPLDRELPAVLKVTSVHLLGIWWYPFGRESIIIAHEPGYRWITVGHPSLRYGRILSREPALSDDALKTAAASLAQEGFDLCAFVFTPQAGGRSDAGRLCDARQGPAESGSPAGSPSASGSAGTGETR